MSLSVSPSNRSQSFVFFCYFLRHLAVSSFTTNRPEFSLVLLSPVSSARYQFLFLYVVPFLLLLSCFSHFLLSPFLLLFLFVSLSLLLVLSLFLSFCYFWILSVCFSVSLPLFLVPSLTVLLSL